jgi:DNA mismatch endonuclease, patch repair protein
VVRADARIQAVRKSPIPQASSLAVLHRMQNTRRRDTPAELALRSALHRRGLRFFVDRRPIAASRRRADVVFPRARIAVYVDGCFWHCCPLHGSLPKANQAWWRAKLERNRRRDRETDEMLHDAGWTVMRVWEHERPDEAAVQIACAVAKAVG